MNNATDIPKEIFDRLDAIASKFCVGAEKGAEFFWPVFVQRQIARGVAYILLSVVLAILTYFIIKLAMYAGGCGDKDKISDDDFPLVVIVLACAIISAIFSVSYLYSGVLQLCSPEYMALKDILSLLK